ncbi:pantoate--beta-alanine ligase [Maribacter sp. 2308TA10-17]|uniref:pantoate--beta-alanine ligase n=1 Tax=Maribacter sp. 2308TA10-17 TaxID=3386276 RepID=UPI0039BD1A1A
MVLTQTKKELDAILSSFNSTNNLGFVPTMGALHKGHIALVRKAVSENKNVVVSIFVNPTQFNNKEDLKKYPKTLESDISLLKKVSDSICVFAPSVAEIYSNSIKTNVYNFDGLDKVMEGEFRDDHFNGVGTVVETLLNLVKPDRAYFGEKDFQQLQIIKKMVDLKKIPVDIIGCPIVREPNGLAMSSRNERLSKAMRKEAALIYKILKAAKKKFGTKSANYILEWIEKQFQEHTEFDLEYVTIADVDTLTPIQKKEKNTKYRAFIAVYAENVRLIDNIALN